MRNLYKNVDKKNPLRWTLNGFFFAHQPSTSENLTYIQKSGMVTTHLF